MAATKVLVVDDSLTMRALISGALERIPNVQVVGAADGADEARGMVETLKPDVMTLDIEMPGMSGIQYLAEIMERKPMPVIMFSTRTTAGAEDSVEALRLGAIDCFPKPKVASSAELDAIIAKLGKRIKSAKGVEQRPTSPAQPKPVSSAIDWNGRFVAIGGDSSSTQALFHLLGSFPADGPPVLVVQHLGPGLLESMVRKLDEQVAPRVIVAADGMAIERGTVYFAPQGEAHMVVDRWPEGKLRLLPRDPVAGERPSISLLFASTARAAAAEAVGILLMPATDDGRTGLNAVMTAGGHGISQAEAGGYTLARRMAEQPVDSNALPAALLKLCSK